MAVITRMYPSGENTATMRNGVGTNGRANMTVSAQQAGRQDQALQEQRRAVVAQRRHVQPNDRVAAPTRV